MEGNYRREFVGLLEGSLEIVREEFAKMLEVICLVS
jgi:hypothetical protein